MRHCRTIYLFIYLFTSKVNVKDMTKDNEILEGLVGQHGVIICCISRHVFIVNTLYHFSGQSTIAISKSRKY